MPFIDRVDAGRRLAGPLLRFAGGDVVVVGLPRGGVPVAAEVAEALQAPMDVLVVRKLGVPFQPELGMGAIGEGGVRVVNPQVVAAVGVTDDELVQVEAAERAELERRAHRYRGQRSRLPLAGRTVIVVDDGIATGSTARAACQVARAAGAALVVLATPVAPPSTVAALQHDADEVVCLETPERFFAIGQFYDDFAQTSDEQVVALLDRVAAAASTHRAAGSAGGFGQSDPPAGAGGSAGGADVPDPLVTAPGSGALALPIEAEVEVAVGAVALDGHLTVPAGATGVVVFAHGSGSGRHSPRNRFVARVLNRAGLGTLLFDLLTPEEEIDRANVFDIGLLARRLVEVTGWVRDHPTCRDLAIGYFGASTGAGAALWAAAEPGADVAAVVSRGGRPDLASGRLGSVRAPTLLVVGGQDTVVLDLNRQAQTEMTCECRLMVVPGATHLFEEPGALQEVAALARGWFSDHLPGAHRGPGLGMTTR